MQAFPGKTAYAVKTNGEPFVLETLAEAGVRAFDVASPGEFAAVRGRLGRRRAALHASGQGAVRHPARRWRAMRIRAMALDHEDEVAKILRIVRALDLDPGDDHAVRAPADARARGLRAVEEIRRGAGACGRTAPAHRPDRLPRRPQLPCRQPDRGPGGLRAGARLGRLGAEPRRRAARRRSTSAAAFPRPTATTRAASAPSCRPSPS